MSGASARSNTGSSASVTGLSFSITTRLWAEELVQHVEHRDRGDVAGAEDRADPTGGLPGFR